MDRLKQTLLKNIDRVFQSVGEAAQDAGRSPMDVTIVAVTKYVDVDVTRTFAQCMIEYFRENPRSTSSGHLPRLGESRAQLLESKVSEWKDGPEVHWDFIGPLQSNKISTVAPLVTLLQSVDRLSLLKKLDGYCHANGHCLDVLLEFNISGDDNKHGFTIENLETLHAVTCQLKAIRPIGLMGMSGLGSNSSQRQSQFEQLAALLPRIREHLPEYLRAGFKTLSMGMSGDYCEAISAGSTMLRIGSSFFEGAR